jgi:hypothetical protein
MPNYDGTGPRGAAAGEEKSFRRGQIEALLMAELDTLGQLVSEHLRGDAERLTAELDRLRKMLLSHLRGEEPEDGHVPNRVQSEPRRAGEQGARP